MKVEVVNLNKKLIIMYLIIIFFSNLITSNSISYELVDKNILPPNPPYIEGPTNCSIRKEYNYNFTISHPENIHLVSLIVIFGDGTNITRNYRGSSCHKGWRPGYTIMIKHKWKKSGDYSIKAKVKDYGGYWSDWGTLYISVVKQKESIEYNPWISRFIERFPILVYLL
jgi:hypothetical protein